MSFLLFCSSAVLCITLIKLVDFLFGIWTFKVKEIKALRIIYDYGYGAYCVEAKITFMGIFYRWRPTTSCRSLFLVQDLFLKYECAEKELDNLAEVVTAHKKRSTTLLIRKV